MPIVPPLAPFNRLAMVLTPALLPPRTNVVVPPATDWPVMPPVIESSRVLSVESLAIV